MVFSNGTQLPPREDPDEVSRRAHDLYERLIRPRVDPARYGDFVVINTQTGEYEIDADDIRAADSALARFPNATLFTIRIGHPAAYHIRGILRAA